MKKIFTFLASALFAMTAAANGEVTDGWLMVEDFEGYEIGAELDVFAIKYSPKGSANVTANPTNAEQKAAHFTSEGEANIIKIPVTLPNDKTLKDYDAISFDLYMGDNVNRNCQMFVVADDYYIVDQSGSYPSQGNLNEWTPKEYSISEDVTASNSFNLSLGISVSSGREYYIDNIRLKEKGYVAPPTSSQNGEIIDGWLMVEDFENSPTITTYNYVGDTPTGTASVIDNPTGGKVASFVGGDHNTVPKIRR